MGLTNILNKVIFGNRLVDYLFAVLVFLVTLLSVKLFIRSFIKHLKKLAAKTTMKFDDFLIDICERIVLPALYISCFYLGIRTLRLSTRIENITNAIQMIIITFFLTRIVILFIGYGINSYFTKKQKDPTLIRSLEGMMIAVKFLIWILAAVILLDNLGYKVSTIIASLGIGGVAVAIAAQSLLKDFFSYFSIVFDHPFKLGDFIVVGDYMGTVEHIGIKTTRIRSISGEQVIFSNTDLTDSRVRNYQLMEKRRVLFRIGVTYQTKLSKLKEIPKIIENIIKSVPDTIFDRVHFFSYGDFSLNFEIVYYVIGAAYNKYMDIQQQINFAIKEEFEKNGIEFAYPTQTIYLNKQ